MTEHSPQSTEPDETVAGTGHTSVDGVVAEVAGLEERPLDEHVAVFERAHEVLRRTLDSPTDTL